MDRPSGIELETLEKPDVTLADEELGHFHLNQQHIRLTQVIFRDQTDGHNELVFEKEWLLLTAERELALSGNLFIFEDILTLAAQANLRSVMRTVLEGSAGQVIFDLDVTAQTRPGFFGAMEAGPLFVENRYTDWHRYWPHQTLRNLWKLTRWVDPRRLRMEWLNHARDQEQYMSDPLAPAVWKPDALFATVMFSNPLGWFEASYLPESYFVQAAPLIKVWKEQREDLFAGTIMPIGFAPDGASWSGFISIGEKASFGYLLLFRQLAGETCQIPLAGLPPKRFHCKRLAGSGRVEIRNGEAVTAESIRLVFYSLVLKYKICPPGTNHPYEQFFVLAPILTFCLVEITFYSRDF